MKRRTQRPQDARTKGKAGSKPDTFTGDVRDPHATAAWLKQQRLAKLDAKAKALFAGKPELAARTRAYLAGELPTRKQEATLTIRLPLDLKGQAEALAPLLAADATIAAARGGGGVVGLSVVVRLALVEGLAVLERRYKRSNRNEP